MSLLVIAGCAETDPAGDSDDLLSPAEPQTFRVISAAEQGQPRPLVADTEIRLTLDGDTISVDAGCNTLTGQARLDAGRLVVSELVTTDRFCSEPLAEQEAWLAAFLTDDPTWQPEGDELVLSTATAELRLTT